MSLLCLSPDPTLTVENMNRIMAKVEPKERMEVYMRVFSDLIIMNIQKQYWKNSEREMAFVDAYVNCDPTLSWHELAKVLYHLHHVAAVEEVRPYLPPRGKF